MKVTINSLGAISVNPQTELPKLEDLGSFLSCLFESTSLTTHLSGLPHFARLFGGPRDPFEYDMQGPAQCLNLL